MNQSEEEIQEWRTQKQSYLKTCIIEAGYPPQEFADYLEEMKPGGK